jgi:uncharacterized cupredoxin-like copper-binding protein
MKHKINIVICFILMGFLFVSSSCSKQKESNTIRIEMGDFYFKPETIRLKAGQQINLELINLGKLEHEFMVGRKVEKEQNINNKEMNHNHTSKEEASNNEQNHNEVSEQNEKTHLHTASFETNFFDGINVVPTIKRGKFIKMPGHGTMLILEPKGTATMSFYVSPDYKGEWEIACFIPGHYEAKMMGKIIVN